MIKKIKKQIEELDTVLSHEVKRRWELEKEIKAIKEKLEAAEVHDEDR